MDTQERRSPWWTDLVDSSTECCQCDRGDDATDDATRDKPGQSGGAIIAWSCRSCERQKALMVSTAFSRSDGDPDWLLIGMIVPGEDVVLGSGEPNVEEKSREPV